MAFCFAYTCIQTNYSVPASRLSIPGPYQCSEDTEGARRGRVAPSMLHPKADVRVRQESLCDYKISKSLKSGWHQFDAELFSRFHQLLLQNFRPRLNTLPKRSATAASAPSLSSSIASPPAPLPSEAYPHPITTVHVHLLLKPRNLGLRRTYLAMKIFQPRSYGEALELGL